MALTLIKEDGSIVTGANTYALVADGDAYAEARLYSDAWTAASGDNKAAALAMATRTIDQQIQFNGFKVRQDQPLQWPRADCPDPDYNASTALVGLFGVGPYFPANVVPQIVVDATCELAFSLLASNRTGDTQGAGLKSLEIAGAIALEFDNATAPEVFPKDVLAMLAKLGRQIGGRAGVVKLQRA